MKDEEHIIVRDRRQKHQFSIHNRVIDEWLPIIGQTGYALYSLYVRMANRDDEHCWPGYTLISKHLGIGRSSVSDHNRLLGWCGLIHIEHGDPNRPNDYYILDIPPVTPETLKKVGQAITDELSPKNKFRQTILTRLENWQPIQALWGNAGSKPIIVHPAQMHLPMDEDSSTVTPPHPTAEQGSPGTEHPSPPAEHPNPVAEQGSPPAEHPNPVAEQGVRPRDCNNPKQQSEPTLQKNNPEQQSTTTAIANAALPRSKADGGVLVGLLADFGVQEPVRSQIASNGVDLAAAQAWIWYTQAQENLRDPVGFVVSRLQQHTPPPDDLLALARVVQQLSEEDLSVLCEYADQRRRDGRWWRLFDEQEGDKRLAALFTEDLLETWYTHAYDGEGRGASSHYEARRSRREDPNTEPAEAPPVPGADTLVSGRLTAAQVWDAARGEFALQMTQATYDTWLRDAKLIAYADDRFVVGVASDYAKDWLENRLASTIDRTMHRLAGREVSVQFVNQPVELAELSR